jgi:ParB/RepB/Spo0J family partition protein
MTPINAETSLILLDKTDFAPDARKHDSAALEILVHDMKVQGQLQEIIVEAKGGRFIVIAGVGRTLAAKKLGWKEIRASVRSGISEFDKARITFAENEDREDVDPFYQAHQLNKMLNANGFKQQELARELGLSPALVSAYVAIYQLPKEISQEFKRLNLGQLIQIARLNNADSKIEFAEKCAKSDLSVRELKRLVDRAIKKPATPLARKSPLPALPDPLAKIWPKFLGKVAPEIYWEVEYGSHKMPKSPSINGWFFFVSPLMEDSLRVDLAKWFRDMARALEPAKKTGRNGTEELPEALKEMKAGEQAIMKHLAPRLPKTSAEEKELESIARTKGPKAVYAWIYGPESAVTQMMPASTWKEMGTTATVGLRDLLNGIKALTTASLGGRNLRPVSGRVI